MPRSTNNSSTPKDAAADRQPSPIPTVDDVKKRPYVGWALLILSTLGISAGVTAYVQGRFSEFYTDYFNYIPLTNNAFAFPTALANVPYATEVVCNGLLVKWVKAKGFKVKGNNNSFVKFLDDDGDYYTATCVRHPDEVSAVAIFSSRYISNNSDEKPALFTHAENFFVFANDVAISEKWVEKRNNKTLIPRSWYSAFSFSTKPTPVSADAVNSFPSNIRDYLNEHEFKTKFCESSVCIVLKPGFEVTITISDTQDQGVVGPDDTNRLVTYRGIIALRRSSYSSFDPEKESNLVTGIPNLASSHRLVSE